MPSHATTAAPDVTAAAAAPELTVRALVTGCLLGAVLTIGNTYMGLKTGFWDYGTITAAILGCAVFTALRRRTRTPYSPLENNITQTTAAAMAAMPSTAGLFGAIPALTFLHTDFSFWAVAAWGLLLALWGVLLAFPLRRPLLEEEHLPFPSGVATAQVIEAMHAANAEAVARARMLIGSGALAALVTWFRDARPAVIPSATMLPGTIGGIPAKALSVGMSWSPMLLGVGAIFGLRVGLSMMLGSLTAWVVMAPVLVRRHVVASAEYEAVVNWLVWPGVALMVGAAITFFLKSAPGMIQGVRTLVASAAAGAPPREHARARGGRLLIPAAVLVVCLLLVGWRGLGASPAALVVAILLSVVLTAVCARVAGQTDISPLTQMGQLTQGLAGGLTVARPTANVVAGSVVAGCACQTSLLLTAWRTGGLLSASARRQAIATVIGALVGSLAAVPAYALLVRAYRLGSKDLPAPFGMVWKTVAEAATGQGATMPPHAATVALVCLILGFTLELLEGTRTRVYVPSALAVGMGFIIPMPLAAAMLLGALLAAGAARLAPAGHERFGTAAASGLIAGESLCGVLVAALRALRVLG